MEAKADPTIRVLLAAMDGGAARAVLSETLDLKVECVGSFAEAAVSLRHGRPDVLVAALAAPRDRDIEFVRQLMDQASGVPVLLISPPVSEELAVGLIKAGVAGYLFASDAHRLPGSVRDLIRGGLPMSKPLSELVLRRARRSSAKIAAVHVSPDAVRTLLSGRQLEILQLLQHGHSYDDIAAALSLSINTVRTHVRVIYERLGASTKVEAVMVALELGILARTQLTSQPPPKA